MSGDPSRPASPAAELFQQAHARLVMLQRVDEQLGHLLDQRLRLQQELSGLRDQIDHEFDRALAPVGAEGAGPAAAGAVDVPPAGAGESADATLARVPRKAFAFVSVAESPPPAAPAPSDGAWVNPGLDALRVNLGARLVGQRP